MKHVDFTRTYSLIQRSFLARVRGSGLITEYLGRLLLPKPTEDVIARNHFGFSLRISPATHIGIERCLYYTGTYEKGTIYMLEQILHEGDLFVDVGANIGIMTIFGSRCVGSSGQVIAFEANPDTRKILDENIALNGIANVVTSPFAVGSERSTGRIYLNTSVERGAASLIKSKASSDFHPVDIIRLDEFEALKNKQVRAIKIDIEGYELEALKGCGAILLDHTAPILILECSETRQNLNSTVKDLFNYIKSANNYRIYKQKKGKERISRLVEITSDEQLPQHDNIYCVPEWELPTLPAEVF